MTRLIWSSAYAAHIPEIDAEHQALFRMVEGLQQAVMDGVAPREVRDPLQELIAHSARHFAREERMMRAAGYSAYGWHKRQHDGARAKVKALAVRIDAGDGEALPALVEYLSGWLRDHTGLTDRMMAACLRNHARTRAVAS